MSGNRSLSVATPVLTEDDTFARLKRTPIEDLDPIYRERRWEFYSNDAEFDAWLKNHGWNRKSFHKAGNEYEYELRRRYL